MKVELIKDDDDKPIGYKIIKENDDDCDVINNIRNLIFFGFDDPHVKYAGRTSSVGERADGSKYDQVETLSFKQKIHITH